MTTNNLQAIIESLLFVSGDEGLSISVLEDLKKHLKSMG